MVPRARLDVAADPGGVLRRHPPLGPVPLPPAELLVGNNGETLAAGSGVVRFDATAGAPLGTLVVTGGALAQPVAMVLGPGAWPLRELRRFAPGRLRACSERGRARPRPAAIPQLDRVRERATILRLAGVRFAAGRLGADSGDLDRRVVGTLESQSGRLQKGEAEQANVSSAHLAHLASLPGPCLARCRVLLPTGVSARGLAYRPGEGSGSRKACERTS